LDDEARNLKARISGTENRLSKLENIANKDDTISEAAKAKVGQAKTDTEEIQKKMQKALEEIKLIINELENLREISTSDLQELGEDRKKINNL
jgi:hypothetical protein